MDHCRSIFCSLTYASKGKCCKVLTILASQFLPSKLWHLHSDSTAH
uniref:Uncharacterized protein n=1 Tax=Rhizophora mucronata TaxID=61149 RepID=A0A2P2QLV5_RHIMU